MVQPRVRYAFERQAMARARHAGQEALHQLPHYVGRRAQLQRPYVRLLLTLREHIHEQRQRERVAVRQLEHPRLLLLSDARAGQQGPRVVRSEVAQRNHTQQVAPARIPPPGGPRTVPARHDDKRTSGQRRDELLTQPVLEPHRSLERVQQQHHRLAAGERLPGDASAGSPTARPSSAMNAGGEGSIARRSRLTTSTPASPAASANAASNAVLPTPPGPCIHNTLNGGSGTHQRPGEQLDLRRTSYEPPPPSTLQAVSHRRRQRPLVRVVPRSRRHRVSFAA